LSEDIGTNIGTKLRNQSIESSIKCGQLRIGIQSSEEVNDLLLRGGSPVSLALLKISTLVVCRSLANVQKQLPGDLAITGDGKIFNALGT
jgi:hypothetical protein